MRTNVFKNRALGVTVRKADLPEILETIDPADTGYITYSPFLSLAAIHLHHNEDDDDDEDQSEEVQEAYNLFTDNRSGPITLVHLRRIAKLLKEDISDEVLKDMLVEANGEGRDGWRRGVGIEDFETVMRRAGVFG
jgi:Ca2+-binding EF-hand superfamily protein